MRSSNNREHLGEKTAGSVITFHVTAHNSFLFFGGFPESKKSIFLCVFLSVCVWSFLRLMTWSDARVFGGCHSRVLWLVSAGESAARRGRNVRRVPSWRRDGRAVSSQHAAAPEDGGSAPPVRSWGSPTDTQLLQTDTHRDTQRDSCRDRGEDTLTLAIPSLCMSQKSLCMSGCGLVLKCFRGWSETSCHVFVWFFSHIVFLFFLNLIPAGYF